MNRLLIKYINVYNIKLTIAIKCQTMYAIYVIVHLLQTMD